MKRTLLLTVLFTALLSITHTQAQSVDSLPIAKDTLSKVSFGIKLGAQFNQIEGSETFQQGYLPGIVGGAFIESTRKKWGIRAEALVSSARYNHVQNDSNQDNAYFSIVYINIVAMAEYEIIHHIWIQAGPQFSSFVSVSRTPSETLDPKTYFQPRDFSGVIGLEARLPKHFTVGARYILGFSNIKNDIVTSTQSWTTRSAQVYIGYRLQ